MANLIIGKVIFEPKDRSKPTLKRTIVQLTREDISVIEESEIRGSIKRNVTAKRLNEDEFGYLEELFLSLIKYGIQMPEYVDDVSRLDYIFADGHRAVYRINDEDGDPVLPWLQILNFIRKNLGINIQTNTHQVISANGMSNGPVRYSWQDEVHKQFKPWLVSHGCPSSGGYPSALKSLVQLMHDLYGVPKIVDLNSLDTQYWDEIYDCFMSHPELQRYNREKHYGPSSALKKRLEYNDDLNDKISLHEDMEIYIHSF